MNRTIFSERLNLSILLALLFIFGAGTLTACNSSGSDLSRAKAEDLIVESASFKQVGMLSLTSRYENDPLSMDKAGNAETSAEGEMRIRQRFLDYNPQITLAVHLGLAEVTQRFAKETKSGGWQVPAQWFFNVSVKLTAKGDAMWKEYNLPPAKDALPLARKEFVKIAGITSLAENQRMAEFTWRWKTNPVGLALQERTAEFQELPEELQKSLLGQTEWNAQPQTENWSGERTARALFQRYDDGWRFVRYW